MVLYDRKELQENMFERPIIFYSKHTFTHIIALIQFPFPSNER